IGIVNEDEGAEVRGEDIDVGEMLVESLEDNDSMNWQFVSKDKAMDEVKNGNYFAVIVIPSDFSEQLGQCFPINLKKPIWNITSTKKLMPLPLKSQIKVQLLSLRKEVVNLFLRIMVLCSIFLFT